MCTCVCTRTHTQTYTCVAPDANLSCNTRNTHTHTHRSARFIYVYLYARPSIGCAETTNFLLFLSQAVRQVLRRSRYSLRSVSVSLDNTFILFHTHTHTPAYPFRPRCTNRGYHTRRDRSLYAPNYGGSDEKKRKTLECSGKPPRGNERRRPTTAQPVRN